MRILQSRAPLPTSIPSFWDRRTQQARLCFCSTPSSRPTFSFHSQDCLLSSGPACLFNRLEGKLDWRTKSPCLNGSVSTAPIKNILWHKTFITVQLLVFISLVFDVQLLSAAEMLWSHFSLLEKIQILTPNYRTSFCCSLHSSWSQK